MRYVSIVAAVFLLPAAALAQTSTQAQSPVMPLAPHAAAYELTLGTVRGNKTVSAASGRIALEFKGNACDGYTMNFRQVTRISDADGDSRTADTRSATFESGDGTTFRFNTQSFMNGAPTQTTDGRAERGADGEVSASLDRPKVLKTDFDGQAVFPTDHMRRLIAAAKAGQNVLEIKVYDGSDGGEKLYDTTALIGPRTTGESPRLDEPARKAGLTSMQRWPVSISYFEPGAGERTPVYVIHFDMFENGVSGALRLDFADFTLRGEMKRLEMLTPVSCDKP
jgi:surface antigen